MCVCGLTFNQCVFCNLFSCCGTKSGESVVLSPCPVPGVVLLLGMVELAEPCRSLGEGLVSDSKLVQQGYQLCAVTWLLCLAERQGRRFLVVMSFLLLRKPINRPPGRAQSPLWPLKH